MVRISGTVIGLLLNRSEGFKAICSDWLTVDCELYPVSFANCVFDQLMPNDPGRIALAYLPYASV